MKKLQYLITLLMAGTVLALSSCVKQDFDNPPDTSKVDPNLPVNMTIANLKAKLAGTTAKKIDSSWTIYGIVNADDRSGNFYKQITIEDSTGGITLLIDANSLYTKLPIGRKVYVKLQGLYYGYYNKLPQIGQAPDATGSMTNITGSAMDKYIVRADYPHTVPVTKFTDLSLLKATNVGMLNRLVEIDNIEVVSGDIGKTYAVDPAISSGTSITLKDCNNNTIIMRTSGYANFKSYKVPGGKGKITALYTTFGTTPQLVIRDTSDVKLYGNRCDGSSGNTQYLLNDGFTDLSNWNAVSVTGAEVWSIAQFGNPKPCALMSGFSGSANHDNEDWLITKDGLNLAGFNTITFTFESASKYSGSALQCYVSKDYTGTGAPGAATWTLLPATYDQSGNFTFTPSGVIDLSTYKGQKIYIAFKYTSTTSAAANWEIDNVKVAAQP